MTEMHCTDEGMRLDQMILVLQNEQLDDCGSEGQSLYCGLPHAHILASHKLELHRLISLNSYLGLDYQDRLIVLLLLKGQFPTMPLYQLEVTLSFGDGGHIEGIKMP